MSQNLSSLPLNAFNDGADTTSSGRQFHRLVTRKEFFHSTRTYCEIGVLNCRVTAMGRVGSGKNFRGFGWVQKVWVGFQESDPRPILTVIGSSLVRVPMFALL